MNFSRSLWLTATLGASQVIWVPVRAQIPVSPPTAPQTASTNATPTEPPLFPGKSPVTLFRELLAVSTVERNRLLADRLPENRKRILAKVREYESLKPDVRELRLQVTELRWYLFPLMTIAPTTRTGRSTSWCGHGRRVRSTNS